MATEKVVNTQSVASVLRQVVAVGALVMGPVTAAVSAIHLPAAVSSVLTAFGGVILAIEHYVSDPSTGSTSSTTATTASLPAGTQHTPVNG